MLCFFLLRTHRSHDVDIGIIKENRSEQSVMLQSVKRKVLCPDFHLCVSRFDTIPQTGRLCSTRHDGGVCLSRDYVPGERTVCSHLGPPNLPTTPLHAIDPGYHRVV